MLQHLKMLLRGKARRLVLGQFQPKCEPLLLRWLRGSPLLVLLLLWLPGPKPKPRSSEPWPR